MCALQISFWLSTTNLDGLQGHKRLNRVFARCVKHMLQFARSSNAILWQLRFNGGTKAQTEHQWVFHTRTRQKMDQYSSSFEQLEKAPFY